MLRTKFFTSGSPKIPNGTLGLYIKGSTATMVLYDYGADTVTPTTSLPNTVSNPTAVGIPSLALIARSTILTTMYKYAFPSTVTSTGSNLTGNSTPIGATTNSTRAIFMVGGTAPIATCKYTYSGDVSVAGGTMASGSTSFSSAPRQGIGNSSVGIFAKAIIGGSAQNGTMKYTYATDTSVVGGNLTLAINGTYGASISTLGIFHHNTVGNTSTNKYTFASDTAVVGSTLSIAGGAGSGGNTYALFSNTANGANSAKYIYSGDITIDGTTLGINQPSLSGAGACSNGVTGVSA